MIQDSGITMAKLQQLKAFDWGNTLRVHITEKPGEEVFVPDTVTGPLRRWRGKQLTATLLLQAVEQYGYHSETADRLENDFEVVATAAKIRLRPARDVAKETRGMQQS